MRGIVVMSLASMAALVACGGEGGDGTPVPENSTASFPVESAFDGIAAAGVNVNLTGKDTATRTANLPNFNDWTGTFSLSRRTPSDAFLTSTPNCVDPLTGAPPTILVDVNIVLTRTRDSLRMQEAATFGYGPSYKPLCAFLLDGHYWTWNLSEALPASSSIAGNLTGVQFTGVSSRTPDSQPVVDSDLTGVVGLDADTTTSAYLSIGYHVIPLSLVPEPALPFRMLGEDSVMRFRIDETGKFIGFQYVRTGVVTDGSGPFTITMSTQ